MSERMRGAVYKSKALKTMAKGVLASFLGMLVVACSGCGGGGGGSSAQPATALAVPPKIVNLDAQGDSTMYGYERVNGVLVQTQNNAPALLQSSLRAQYGATVSVKNDGVGGSTIAQRLNGTVPYTAPYTPDSSQIVIGNWALNDAAQSVDVQQFQSSIVQFVTLVRAAGKTVVLEEPNPSTTVANLGAYVAAIDYVATQMNVPLVQQYVYIQSLPGWQSMLTDGVHPNDAMYAIKAQREADVIGPIVATLLH
ncbi:SGNH/GDSL hydrolase family protein [Paraburkholderia azotifigens]|uniref:SGNH/GDSL hydrolase family protein n=1 Tax=Paraburkholderia azotifigens TaxID=2057004 RepID=UPI0038BAE80A